jgi:hypothetical protein
MDSKFYVSLEAARLMKEKGYNEDCEQIIKDDGEILYGYNVNYKLPVTLFSCPTKAEVIDWLESKGIVIEVQYRKLTRKYFSEIHYNKMRYKDRPSYLTEDYKTRLEAEEDAIIKALELL